MKVHVRQTGGIANLDHRIELSGNRLLVYRNGSRLKGGNVEADVAERVHRAAERLLTTPRKRRSKSSHASDDMVTKVSVSDGAGARHVYTVQSGDETASELWDVVDALADVARSA